MRISVATPKAIRYACMKFHYAKAVPSVQYGFNIFNDNDEWCGVICYGGGANNNLPKSCGMCAGEVLELVRVALNGKQGHGKTSQAVALSLRHLRKINPIIKMIVSYADCDQDHVGTIYQATNWIYLGRMNEGTKTTFIIHGKQYHPRSVNAKGWKQSVPWLKEHIDKNATQLTSLGKRKYVFCYEKRLRKKYNKQSVPYPKK